jgi:Big-like domain-containing protein
VTDSTGATATSAARTIRVNTLPSVSLTAPANGANFIPGSTIALAATATDSDGTISQVQFFRGGTTLIGSDTTSPYSFNWTNVAAGTYSLTARATDNNSGVTTSTVVNITLDRAPTVSISAPANNAVFTAPASVTVTATAADADGTVSKVDFFDGATLAASATAAPYSATLANLQPGTHVLTARATDNLGVSTTSAAVTVRVDAPPGVNISAPANNAIFTAPANITIAATATDTDGTVTKVDFFDGATLIGTATAAPYSVTLPNAALGSHSFSGDCGDWNEDCGTDECVDKTARSYPNPSFYGLLTYNSNTFAGTIARKCRLSKPTGRYPTPGWDNAASSPAQGVPQIPFNSTPPKTRPQDPFSQQGAP